MKVIAFANEKGGVLKTTSTVHTAVALGRLGKRVLQIDVDPQMHASRWLGLDPAQRSIYDLLLDTKDGLKPGIQASRFANVDGIAGSRSLGDVDRFLLGYTKPIAMLQWLIGTLPEHEYDFVLIDCPPSVGRLAGNALVAATHVVAPMTPDDLALDGFAQINQTIAGLCQPGPNQARDTAPPSVSVLRTKWVHRIVIAKNIDAKLDGHGVHRFKTTISVNVRGCEAFSHGETLYEYDPKGKTGSEYDAFAREIVEHVAGAQNGAAA